MIIIDGHQSTLNISNFANLEEILSSAIKEDTLENRIVTEIRLNERMFSELYPNQASDIAISAIQHVEITSMAVNEMALAITGELFTVLKIMSIGSRHVTHLFNQSSDTSALELLVDLLDVTRNFLSMISVLRTSYTDDTIDQIDISQHVERIANLLAEMTEIMEAKDWLLLADLIEFEFIPQCDTWKEIITQLKTSIESK